MFDSDGAVQVDDVVVTFNGEPIDGGGDPDGVATFQGGDNEAWFIPAEPCTPKWSYLIPALYEDEDPYQDNLTPQLAFLVKPVADPEELFPSCSFTSPEIDWPGITTSSRQPDGAVLQFRTYSTGDNFYYVRYWWMVRSFVDGAWTQWTNDNNTEPQTFGRFRVDQYDISDWVDPDATKIQVALQGADFWPASTGIWGEVVMTFDDVSVARYYRNAVELADGNITFRGAYPNPANPSTSIAFSLPQSGVVQLTVFDVRGRRVRTLLDGLTDAGDHTVHFDGRDDGGNQVASGVYFLRLNALGEVRTQRLVLVR
jgi:hypothetical protein